MNSRPSLSFVPISSGTFACCPSTIVAIGDPEQRDVVHRARNGIAPASSWATRWEKATIAAKISSADAAFNTAACPRVLLRGSQRSPTPSAPARRSCWPGQVPGTGRWPCGTVRRRPACSSAPSPTSPRRFPEDRDVVRITAECRDIVAHPRQGEDLVVEADVGVEHRLIAARCSGRGTECADPVIHAHEHDVTVLHQPPSVVVARRADGECAAVDPPLPGADRFSGRADDVDRQAVLRPVPCVADAAERLRHRRLDRRCPHDVARNVSSRGAAAAGRRKRSSPSAVCAYGMPYQASVAPGRLREQHPPSW